MEVFQEKLGIIIVASHDRVLICFELELLFGRKTLL